MTSTTYTILSNIYVSRLVRYVDLVIKSMELHVPNQLLVHSAYIRHWGGDPEIPLSCTPAIYKFQQSQWFSLEGGSV